MAAALAEAMASEAYARRRPGDSVLVRIVQEHFETFRLRAATVRDGAGLPRFVERAFRDLLRCGWLSNGFARFRCTACGLDRLVAFSCKGRAVCPSCAGRRMAERAAHLVDHVLPDVPVRQWVLTLPYRLRYLLAWDHDCCRKVAAILARAIERLLQERARDNAVEGGRGGSVIVIQRFGGALNLNVHFHALVLDGVWVREAGGLLTFRPVERLTSLDVHEVLATVEARVRRHLEARGLSAEAAETGAIDRCEETEPLLAMLAAGSVQGVDSFGAPRRVGTRRARGDDTPGRESVPGLVARGNGYTLHAGAVVLAGHRTRLEEVCRYVLRPPVAAERLALPDAGEVVVTLKTPWRDGTTAIRFDPVTFLARLAALVPRPRVNLILYYGVFGARAAWRSGVVAGRAVRHDDVPVPGREGAGRVPAAGPPRWNPTWANLMQRVFGFDVLACPRCAARMRLIALIGQADVVRRILTHVGEPVDLPQPLPARAPPDQQRLLEM